ncbi:RsmB/NOP family class I SAM-dependent RNA methyltransferase [Candidatus Similichlamydia epinepheli]|uniref:RsmB/NOP family class I SAM-dependent RNA methyltransferase n=1 Tax=Candidatus Similichlamydia epinepheli TaxID=1903953 RepID=UPI000D340E7E|nr:RsmB/NOP family class I SAM-dependent RNA methyltransferase [Candidatus Similichlamydia epinepheli]
MIFRKFRSYHLLTLLETFDPKRGALDRFLSYYFRKNRSIGSKDRSEIVQNIYMLIRFWRLCDATAGFKLNWNRRLELLNRFGVVNLQERLGENRPERYGIGPILFQRMKRSFDQPTLGEQLNILNEQAPISIRANLIKISREDLLPILPKMLNPMPSAYAPNAIILSKRENLLTLSSFKEGLFELQDEGSQLIANFVDCAPGDRVLDYCAGSGGKTLAFAPKMKNKGEILLYDVRSSLLRKAKDRLKRAGIYNVRFCTSETDPPKKYHNKMDWVVLDVPCSGSGSMRRHPELRESLEITELSYWVEKQRDIFRKAIAFVKPGGLLIYITCSLFREENCDQIEFFLKNHPISLVKDPTHIRLTSGGPDGFFSALFQKKSSY